MIVQATHRKEGIMTRTEMIDRVIPHRNVLNPIRMTSLLVVRKAMIGRAIHHEMMGLHIVHHQEKVRHHLVDALQVAAVVVAILQAVVAPVILLVDQAIHLVVHQVDPVHLQEAGDNTNIMI